MSKFILIFALFAVSLLASCADIIITRDLGSAPTVLPKCEDFAGFKVQLLQISQGDDGIKLPSKFDTSEVIKRQFQNDVCLSNVPVDYLRTLPLNKSATKTSAQNPFLFSGSIDDLLVSQKAAAASNLINVVAVVNSDDGDTSFNPLRYLWKVVSFVTLNIIPYTDASRERFIVATTKPGSNQVSTIARFGDSTRLWVWLPFLFTSRGHYFTKARDQANSDVSERLRDVIQANGPQIKSQ